MAEAIAKKLLSEEFGESNVEVISAGTAALEGSPASPQAVEVMKKKGIDLLGHRAKRVTPELIEKADLVLTMTEGHKRQILAMVPSAWGKVFTLKEYVLDKLGCASPEYLEVKAILEEKEKEFFKKYGREMEELRRQYRELEMRLRTIEREMLELEREYAEFTRPEREKLYSLSRGANILDISDPFGQSIDEYEILSLEMEEYIKHALEKFLAEKRDTCDT